MSDNINELIDKTTVSGEFLMYKDRPLVRENNTICYGHMDDDYVLCLTIMNETEQDGKLCPDMVLVQIVRTDENLPTHEKIYKQDIKKGLTEAFQLGYVWLTRLIGD